MNDEDSRTEIARLKKADRAEVARLIRRYPHLSDEELLLKLEEIKSRRLMALAGVIAVLAILCCGGFGSLLTIIGSVASSGSRSLHDQCDSAVGPSSTEVPSSIEQSPVPQTRPSPAPTTNPFAQLTIAPDETASEWLRECVAAMRYAPFQQPASRTANTGIAAACARQLLTDPLLWTNSPPQGEADLARKVTYWASSAAVSGSCSSAISTVPPMINPPAGQGCAAPYPSGARSPVILPEETRRQAYCGQRVHPSAVSPGDLVFWDFKRNAATRVAVAVDADEMLTIDTGGQLRHERIPSQVDVRVKRVLS
jgi:hypothetical protein